MLVDLLVLASSRKGGGRCIAGYDIDNDRWLRPVSELDDGTLLPQHCAIDGDWPQVFDLVRIEISEPVPEPWQPENWRLTERAWERRQRVELDDVADDLRGLVDEGIRLVAQSGRTIAGAALEQNPIDASLTLVRPTQLHWRIERSPWGTRQQKANFQLQSGAWFDLHVTDPPIEQAMHALPEGGHARGAVGIADDADVLLTLSLSEPYERNNDCYKLVAAVLPLPA